ncbi:MAG: biotin/lipoyl-binding protein [Elusimicrobiota bacterium]
MNDAEGRPLPPSAPEPKPGAAPPPAPWRLSARSVLFALSFAGLVAGLFAAHYHGIKKPPLPPAFKPAENPYSNGIYSEGIIESVQASGLNVNVFPEVAATVRKVLVAEGQAVEKGTPLLLLDDSVPRAQANAARAAMKSAEDTLAKDEAAVALDPRSVSRDALDTARSAAAAARANHEAAAALLEKYLLRAPSSGVVLTVNAAVNGYASPQGVYDAYTQGYGPALTLGAPQADLHVRCYVDEILVTRLPSPAVIKAQLAIRGSDIRIPLQFVRVQPFLSPKIELSDQKQELVDIRVLPVIFRFAKPSNVNLYPGELVDVYIGE